MKRELFSVFDSADDDEIEASWEAVHQMNDSITMSDTSNSTLQRKEKLQAFFDHCCQICHYSFCVKKCGSREYDICKPVRMDSERHKYPGNDRPSLIQ